MELETITEVGKEAIVDLLNKAIQIEYGMILNYPRMIDMLVNINQINDEQLNRDLENVGKASSQHLGMVNNLIRKLGGDTVWQINTIDRFTDVPKTLSEQLNKEEVAKSVYEEAKHIALTNVKRIPAKEIFDNSVLVVDDLPVGVVVPKEITSVLDRIIMDEQDHIRRVEDSIATLEILTNK
jgi:bacterioferritin (cytochrome b1)